MSLKELREEIDAIDAALIEKLEERFGIVAKIGEYKKANGIDIVDPEREWKKLEEIESMSKPEFAEYNLDVFESIIMASRDIQNEG